MSLLHRLRRKGAPARKPFQTAAAVLSLLFYGALLLAALLLAVGQPAGAPSPGGGCPPASIRRAGASEPRKGAALPRLGGTRAEPVTCIT
jgi:hypothetical protein